MCWSHVSWAEIKDPRNVPHARKAYFSQILWHIKKLIQQHDHYTGAGDIKRPQTTATKCAVLSHNRMPQMSQVLRERAIGMLTAGMSTRAVARECYVHFSTISCLQRRCREFVGIFSRNRESVWSPPHNSDNYLLNYIYMIQGWTQSCIQ
jgi:hypothetical protein